MNYYRVLHLTSTVLLHYLAKFKTIIIVERLLIPSKLLNITSNLTNLTTFT